MCHAHTGTLERCWPIVHARRYRQSDGEAESGSPPPGTPRHGNATDRGHPRPCPRFPPLYIARDIRLNRAVWPEPGSRLLTVGEIVARNVAFTAAVEAAERNPRLIAMHWLEQEVGAELAGRGYYRGCFVCEHRQRVAIEDDLRFGQSLHRIARAHGLSSTVALWQHRPDRHAATTRVRELVKCAGFSDSRWLRKVELNPTSEGRSNRRAARSF